MYSIIRMTYSLFTEELFKCQICDRSYLSKYSLNHHMIIHDESKVFKCDVCFKSFVSRSKLKVHYRTHTGEKPFACQVCDKKFALKSNLVQHQAIHSDVRPFKCSICPEGRYFKTKQNLNQHMVFHYEPKFACSHCHHKSYSEGDLKRHEKKHNKKTLL